MHDIDNGLEYRYRRYGRLLKTALQAARWRLCWKPGKQARSREQGAFMSREWYYIAVAHYLPDWKSFNT